MRQPRGIRAVLGNLVALLVLVVALGQPPVTVAQSTAAGQASSSHTVGTSTISFTGDWVLDPSLSDHASILLSHQQVPSTLFLYTEFAEPTDADATTVLNEFATGFFSEFGDGNQQVVTSGTMPTATGWQLYTVDQSGIPFGLLLTADLASQPGQVMVSVLLAPHGSFDLALQAVLDGVDLNGAGSPLTGFHPAELGAALSGPGQLTPTQTPTQPLATSTPAQIGGLTLPPLNPTTATEPPVPPTPAAGGLTLPPLNPTPPAASTGGQTTGGNEITVAGTTIRYGEGWTYTEEISTPDEIAFFSLDAATMVLYAYATIADASGDDALTALQEFNTGFFSTFGAVDVQRVATETLPSGLAYAVNTGMLNGAPVIVLAYADVTSAPGQFRVQLLITLAAEFETALVDARATLQVDGAKAFRDLDPAAIFAQLGGEALIPPATTTTAPAADVSQYEAQDAQGTCDTIGWVATAADQLPVTEQDVTDRAACVGGGTYVAACGTVAGTQFFAPEPGMQWVRCDVIVRVDGAPVEVSFVDFSLVDGAGNRYSFDLLGMAALENGRAFPEGPVATGQTASGSVVFSVPEGVATPMVLEIAPIALLSSSGATGTLVIADPLQPFEMIGL